MVIKTYKDSGNGRYTKVFFTVDDGEVRSVKVGNQVVPLEQGFQFYVDDYVALQIDKCELSLDGMPKLRLKEGEELEIPDELEKKRREIEELERKLEKLKRG